MPFRRWSVTAVLATFLAVLATSLARAQAAPADEPPPTTLPSRPLRDSVDRVVGKLEEERKAPCRKVAEGVPCFPVSIEVSRPDDTISVRDLLRNLGPPDGTPSSRPASGFTFDPGCVGKSLLKRLKGKNDTYYLYRLRDVHGERVALYDHRLEAATFQGALEFLGQFDGECDALAAYRHEDRKTGTPQPLPPK